MFDKPIIHTSDPYQKITEKSNINKSIYYGEVTSIDDSTDGGMIKVKILELDGRILNENLPYCYPLLPKYFHLYPKEGEIVRIIIEDPRYPQKGRFWIGNIVSQLHKVEYDSKYTALSTTNIGAVSPEKAPSSYPDANGVYPNKEDIGIIGRKNTDILLKPNQVMIRAGKHLNNEPLKSNNLNPACMLISFDKTDNNEYYSNNIIMSDKIALISHSGNPKFKSNNLTEEDRKKIFIEGHPIPRGDLLINVLNIIRKALVNHIHPYSNSEADLDASINELNNIDFNNIIQPNIVIN
jgi:hypothetical protein